MSHPDKVTCSGFTLVELVLVLAIMGTLLTIAAINFNDWQRKAMIEKNTRELFADLNVLRQQAMTRKRVHVASINSSRYVFKQLTSAADNGNAASATLLDKVSSSHLTDTAGVDLTGITISFDQLGYTNNFRTIVVGPVASSASVNCLRVHAARTNVGKMNGADCEFK